MTHILFAILVLALLALAFGIILGFAAVKFHVEADPIVDQLDALLPQTQCGQCGYRAASPTPKPWPMATRSTSACQVAMPPCARLPT
jgi:RnfABCDGE-type electron transport complex B subunit